MSDNHAKCRPCIFFLSAGITGKATLGVVIFPWRLAETRANLLVNDALDPQVKILENTVCGMRVFRAVANGLPNPGYIVQRDDIKARYRKIQSRPRSCHGVDVASGSIGRLSHTV